MTSTPREAINVARREIEEANRDIAFHFQQQIQELTNALQDAQQQAKATKLTTEAETASLTTQVEDVERRLEEIGRKHDEAKQNASSMATIIEGLRIDRDAALMRVERLTNASIDSQDENAQVQQDKYCIAMGGINKLYARSDEIEDIIVKLEEHRTSAKIEDEQQLMQSNFEDISMGTFSA